MTLPVERILWAPTNSAHYNHLHVVGAPRVSGTLADASSKWTPAIVAIYDALNNEFGPGSHYDLDPSAAWTHLGIYNPRYIAGTTVPSQHAFSNAIDIGPYYGVAEQQVFYDFLTKEANMDIGQQKGVDNIFKAVWKEMQDEGVFSEHTDPDDTPRMEELAAFLSRYTRAVVIDEIEKAIVEAGTVDAVARATLARIKQAI